MASRRNPYPALAAIALIPALLLAGCWRFAVGRSPEEGEHPTDVTNAVTKPGVLPTPLLSVRRTPAMLSRDVSHPPFVDEAQAFLPHIDGTSCVALSVDGLLVASKNADLPLRPASNVKLVTSSVALELLGPAFTYTTEVRGTVQGGVVLGDLHLIGGGDPVLSSSWWKGPNVKYPPFNTTSIEQLAQQVKAAGVTTVQGSVVGDASRYDDEWYAPSWTKDVRFTEGGPISALLVNDSREGVNTSSNDPVVGAATVFTNALRDAGVNVTGKPSSGVAPKDETVITSIASQPLAAVLQEMLTTSDNNTAEMVLKEIGKQKGVGGTREAGLSVVDRTLRSWGTPMAGVTMVDGSGLSDDNRLTCNALLHVLQHDAPTDAVGLGLPIAGKAGGTLSDAFVGTGLEGVLRGKTGTLYNYSDGTGGKPAAKSLSGFVPQKGGGAVEFSMLLNGPQVAEKVVYRPIWDAFGTLLLTYPTGPTPAVLAPR
jgi:D-alanyl-D-alanine carboxypeptidase/D-alanyl-D-alanine-endopeptidase (penicillin-binding protein 4)